MAPLTDFSAGIDVPGCRDCGLRQCSGMSPERAGDRGEPTEVI
jgi:hypothetical protein